jgi:opacity protein-like surface antigen
LKNLFFTKKDKYLLNFVLAGICLFVAGNSAALAQKIELGAGLGGFNYKGDIAPSQRLRFIRPGGSFFFRFNPNQTLSLKAEIAAGVIGASDEHSKDPFQVARNRSFRSGIVEGSAVAEYNFLNFQERRFAVNWSPYLFGGIGYSKFNPQTQTSAYKTTTFVLPYGVGVKYQFKRPWNIGLEYGARKTFTDYLDDLGGEPVSTDKIQQGDPSLKDNYYYIRLSVSYTFYKIVCP